MKVFKIELLIHTNLAFQYTTLINRKPIAEHEKVCVLLTGNFNQRPPQLSTPSSGMFI